MGVSVLTGIAVLGAAVSCFLGEVLSKWRISFELRVSLPINIGQNSSAGAIDMPDSAEVDPQLSAAEGRTERMPSAIQFGCPRSDDPSLQLQHDFLRSFVNCDSEHMTICGNRRAKVTADTGERVIRKGTNRLRLWLRFLR